MQARTRYIASLVLLTLSTISIQYPVSAQHQSYGSSRYPKILSALEDSSGNFLLLNLQSKAALSAPSIHYVTGNEGQTVMLVDFMGVIWNQESQLFKPANPLIESVRLGQFQSSPPVFRISISTKSPESLKRIEFNAQARSLSIKFPSRQDFALRNPEVPPLAPPIKKNKYGAEKIAARSVGTVTSTQSSPQALESKSSFPQPASTKHPDLTKVPFRPGGLYFALGSSADKESLDLPSNDVQAEKTLTDVNTAAITTAATASIDKQSLNAKPAAQASDARNAEHLISKKKVQEKKLSADIANQTVVPLAPDRKISTLQSTMPPKAPDLTRTANANLQAEQTSSDENKKKAGTFFKRLFHKKTTDEDLAISSEETPASSDSNNAAPALKSPKVSKKAEEDSKLALNPQILFEGKDPYKVKLKFDSAIKYKSFRLDDPPRFVLDVDDLQARYNPVQEPENNPWLKSVRIGTPEEKHTRIVLDLAQSRTQIKEEVDPEKQTLTLTLCADNSIAKATETATVKGREVVLDAGHGGSDPGAQRGDIQEKEITLQITQKLKRYLEERGVKVIMTRSDDTFVSLEDRVKITNSTHPDAFVSIHINSLETDRDIKGIETYYQNEQSRALASKVHEKLVEKLLVPDRNVRKARFYVVNHTDRPAILAEVGFISNKDEREKLISSDYQAKVAESVGQGVILYLTNATEPASASVSLAEPEASKSRQTGGSRNNPALASESLNAVKQKVSKPF